MSRRILVLIGLLLQTLAVFALFVPNAYHHAFGKTITLQTVPVDPMSIFRGEYVTLDYAIGQDVPTTEKWGTVVYVTLEPNADGVYERVAVSEAKPQLSGDQVCLAGRDSGWGRIEFPEIGQYFVEEGLGKEIENVRNMHLLLADVSVQGCSGLIKQLRMGEEVPVPVPDVIPFDDGRMPPQPL